MQNREPTRTEIRVGVACTFAILLSAVVFNASSFDEISHFDFGGLYTSGYMVLKGDGAKLYDISEEAKYQELLLKRPGYVIQLHPPFEALFYLPLSLLHYQLAYVVWGLINILFWMGFVYQVRPHAPVPRQTFQYLLMCFAFFPMWIGLFQGQPSILLLLIYLLTFLRVKRRDDFEGGLWLGLGLFKFQLVLPFVLIFALRRKWKFLVGFGVTALILGLVSVFAVGLEGVLAYFNLISSTVAHPANPQFPTIIPEFMPNLRGFISALVPHTLPSRWLDGAVALLSLTLILFTASRWHQEEKEGDASSLELMFAAALMVSLLAGFHLYVHDLSPMMLAILLVLGSPQWRQPSKWIPVVQACIGTIYMATFCLLFIDWHKLYLLCPVMVLFTLGAIKLLRNPNAIPLD